MKQAVCEICGKADLMKNDGVFVCQVCGTKYSVEEVKKMLVDTSITTQDTNVPTQDLNIIQIEKLLNLAESSLKSQNYKDAEGFCNNILMIDDKNYKGWWLKAKAVNGQISYNNSRIEEVFNCIMIAYDFFSDGDKKNIGMGWIVWLMSAFQNEILRNLEEVISQRLTKAKVDKVCNSFIDLRNKIRIVAEKMELEKKSTEIFLNKLDEFFCVSTNSVCVTAWNTTVGYNYYREYMDKGIDPFGRSERKWVISTELYRPSKHIWNTFLIETDLLIELLQFAERQFNDSTNEKVKENIYLNIAYFESCIIPSGSWKVTQGYTSGWDQYTSIGLFEESVLTDEAKSLRQMIKDDYERLADIAKKNGEKKKKEYELKKIEEYWGNHVEEKKILDDEKEALESEVSSLTLKLDTISYEKEISALDDSIKLMENKMSSLGIFKGKEKRCIQEQIDTANEEKRLIYDKETSEKMVIYKEIAKKRKRIEDIIKELTKVR